MPTLNNLSVWNRAALRTNSALLASFAGTEKAEVWQYPAGVLHPRRLPYRDKGTLSVDYVELRGRGTAQLSRQDCYRRMLQTHLTREQAKALAFSP